MTQTVQVSPPGRQSVPAARPAKVLITLGVVLLSAVLLYFNYPQRYEYRDIDETGYLNGSLEVLEGITPGNGFAPAGPQIWLGWARVGAQAAKNILRPTASERAEPMQVRPYSAINRALFDNYRDLSNLHTFVIRANILLALAAAAAAAGLGMRLGGLAGGALLGGLVAATPIFMGFAEQSRPYSNAWSFAIIAFYFAATCKGRRQVWLTGLFLGLSIASRIEMAWAVPLAWWIIGSRPDRSHPLATILKITALMAVFAYLFAPWLLTDFFANLRTIATVGFGIPLPGIKRFTYPLYVFGIQQGMIGCVLLALGGLIFARPGARLRLWILGGYGALLLAVMITGFGMGIHQHPGLFLTMFILSAASVSALRSRWPREIPAVIAIVLAFSTFREIQTIRQYRALYDHEQSTQWIEAHVPAGTTVYFSSGGYRSLLPTPASADALWSEVTDDQAWRKKFESGLKHFHVTTDQLPRALSEANLLLERSNRRGWFILGSRTDLPDPRYDIRLVLTSPIFGVQDLQTAMRQQGGILVWRESGSNLKKPDLGPPLVQWLNQDGYGTSIYCTPDVRAKIKLP
ncbi:MAG: hypothetical protein ABSF29_09195 [Tepidisphaeraceae bacterium]|jgi:hypothetical protein